MNNNQLLKFYNVTDKSHSEHDGVDYYVIMSEDDGYRLRQAYSTEADTGKPMAYEAVLTHLDSRTYIEIWGTREHGLAEESPRYISDILVQLSGYGNVSIERANELMKHYQVAIEVAEDVRVQLLGRAPA